MIINNPKDPSSSPDAAVAMQTLRMRENGCSPVQDDVEPRTLLCKEARSCQSGDVVYCPHNLDTDRRGVFYPHQWPDGAAEAIVGFFRTMK
jgi:polyhydroxybutyrate depolymerase